MVEIIAGARGEKCLFGKPLGVGTQRLKIALFRLTRKWHDLKYKRKVKIIFSQENIENKLSPVFFFHHTKMN